jgi:predicted HNH restriction endonuclease
MTEIQNLYQSIRKRSRFLINNGDQWRKEIASAKNYVTVPGFRDWTFGKSAGLDEGYHADGGQAKQWLYNKGFTNILKLPDSNWKEGVIQSFLSWCNRVEAFDIAGKFERDQAQASRFELLVHKSLLPIDKRPSVRAIENERLYHEGFRQQIFTEISKRNSSLIQKAKAVYGTTCEVCGFDFEKTYGTHGEGFIEMHHLYPIASGTRSTKLEDVRPVCANCHRMLHRGPKLLSIEELKDILKLVTKERKKA